MTDMPEDTLFEDFTTVLDSDGDAVATARDIETNVAKIQNKLKHYAKQLLLSAKYMLVIWGQFLAYKTAWKDWYQGQDLSLVLAYISLSIGLILSISALIGILSKKDKSKSDYFNAFMLLATSALIIAAMFVSTSLAPVLRIVLQSVIIITQLVALVGFIKKLDAAPKGSDEAMAYRQAIVGNIATITGALAIITLTVAAFFPPVWPLMIAMATVALLVTAVKFMFTAMPRSSKQKLKAWFGFGKEAYEDKPTVEVEEEAQLEDSEQSLVIDREARALSHPRIPPDRLSFFASSPKKPHVDTREAFLETKARWAASMPDRAPEPFSPVHDEAELGPRMSY